MPAEEQQQACMESKKSQGKDPSSRDHHPFALLSFFKVMIGDFSQALFLPPIVAKKLSALLNHNVDIEDSNGHRWGVKVSLVDNHLAFEQGWQDFVLDHSIKVGEFVVFNHVDRLLFSAKIYAITGCERLEFVEKFIATKNKGKRKNETSADDLSLKKCQSVGKLDKDVFDSNKGLIKKKQTTKLAPGDTSDSMMVTRSRKAGVKRKAEDVNALKTSHVRRESSERQQIEIAEPIVLLDEMVDKTCQISPAGPVNMDVDVMTMTDGDNSNNVGDSISEGMSRDFVMEEQMPNVKLAQVPVKVASRGSVFMKGNTAVSSPDMIASEAKGKSCNAVETDTLVTIAKSSHGSLNETEADCVAFVNPLIRNSVLTGDSPQGVVAVSSVNWTASEAKGNLCSTIEADTLVINEELSPHHHLSPVNCQPLLSSEIDENGSQNENVIVDSLITDGLLNGESPHENVAIASVISIPTEAIGNSCDVRQTTDELLLNEERKCTGHGS
ncbi:putative transcription factor B3-Domain family [Dioscorea sansibarensis]